MSDLIGTPSPAEDAGAGLPPTAELAGLARDDQNFRLGLAGGIARDPLLGSMVEDAGLTQLDDGRYMDAYGDITGPWRAILEPTLRLEGQDPDSEALRASARRVARETYERLYPRSTEDVAPAEDALVDEEPQTGATEAETKGGFVGFGMAEGFVDVDGNPVENPPWVTPTPERVGWEGDSENDPGVLAQSNLSETNRNSSCRLTALLNAWVVRGALSPEDAAYVQEKLVYDDYYKDNARYWQSLPDDPTGNEFVYSPAVAADEVTMLAKEEMELPLAVETVPDATAPTRLNELLDEGYVLVLGDTHHFQTVFRPRNFPPGQALVTDPQGGITRRVHMNAVVALHHEDRSVVKV